MSERLTYGIDVHGTLAIRGEDGILRRSNLAQLLVPLTESLRRQGAKVYIVSGPPWKTICEELKSIGLYGEDFDGVLSVVDFLRERGIHMEERPPGSGHWWCDEEIWNAAKGWICDAFDIDILIDNEEAYRRAMPSRTEFVLVHATLLDGEDE